MLHVEIVVTRPFAFLCKSKYSTDADGVDWNGVWMHFLHWFHVSHDGTSWVFIQTISGQQAEESTVSERGSATDRATLTWVFCFVFLGCNWMILIFDSNPPPSPVIYFKVVFFLNKNGFIQVYMCFSFEVF